MKNFTGKDEQTFLNACAALNVEPKAMTDTLKERYVVSGFLKDPLTWLETELQDRTYATRGEAQEAANSVERFINEGGDDGPAKPGWSTKAVQGRHRVQRSNGARSDIITNQRGEGAHLLDALWLRSLGDVTGLRRLRFRCRNTGQMIAEHEISEMIEYLEESETTRVNHLRDWSDLREKKI
jgi:hypothetical protein